MLRKIILSLLWLACGAWSLSATGVTQRITGAVSVTFPAAPRATHIDDQQNYLYETDTCAWLAQSKPYMGHVSVHDSATLASFYEGMAKGILRAAKGTETHRSYVQTGSIRTLEIEYVKGDQRSLPATVCSRALKVNGQVVIVSFTAPTQLYDRMAGIRDRFFSSITFDRDSTIAAYDPYTAADSSRVAAAAAQASAKGDTTATATATPATVPFMDSHAGSVIKMFGLLIMVCALIYGWAVYTRRKG